MSHTWPDQGSQPEIHYTDWMSDIHGFVSCSSFHAERQRWPFATIWHCHESPMRVCLVQASTTLRGTGGERQHCLQVPPLYLSHMLPYQHQSFCSLLLFGQDFQCFWHNFGHLKRWSTLSDNRRQACKVFRIDADLLKLKSQSGMSCSYHGWAFEGEQGKCVQIPQAADKKSLTNACNSTLPHHNIPGFIFLIFKYCYFYFVV